MSAIAATPDAAQYTRRRLPGDPDVWIFISAELLMFGAFFIAYIVSRAGEVELFNASQLSLNRYFGVLNTLLLLTSSWAVVQAVAAVRRNRAALAPPYLLTAIGLGLAFVIVKVFEYSAKFEAGLSMTTNSFYMFYFCLTMIHLAHVLAGTLILLVLWTNARNGNYDAAHIKGLETGASYWHMVDLLWIFLFALLYLLR